jgi:hypothetical protein
MKRFLSFLSLFASASTLLCCAIPALFVVLGMGAAFAGLVGIFPQIVWISENKPAVFGGGALLLLGAGILQYRARTAACPIDPKLGETCAVTRDWSKIIYFVSVTLFSVGAFFAFIAPKLFQ